MLKAFQMHDAETCLKNCHSEVLNMNSLLRHPLSRVKSRPPTHLTLSQCSNLNNQANFGLKYETMDSVVCYGKHDYKYEKRRIPVDLAPDEALINVKRVGICAGGNFISMKSRNFWKCLNWGAMAQIQNVTWERLCSGYPILSCIYPIQSYLILYYPILGTQRIR